MSFQTSESILKMNDSGIQIKDIESLYITYFDRAGNVLKYVFFFFFTLGGNYNDCRPLFSKIEKSSRTLNPFLVCKQTRSNLQAKMLPKVQFLNIVPKSTSM